MKPRYESETSYGIRYVNHICGIDEECDDIGYFADDIWHDMKYDILERWSEAFEYMALLPDTQSIVMIWKYLCNKRLPVRHQVGNIVQNKSLKRDIEYAVTHMENAKANKIIHVINLEARIMKNRLERSKHSLYGSKILKKLAARHKMNAMRCAKDLALLLQETWL